MFEEAVDLKKRASASEKDDIKCLNYFNKRWQCSVKCYFTLLHLYLRPCMPLSLAGMCNVVFSRLGSGTAIQLSLI